MRTGARRLIQRFIKSNPLGILLNDFKNFLVNAPTEVTRIEARFVSRKPQGRPKGNVLLCYNNHAFVVKSEDDPVLFRHTNRWESLQIAKTFLSLGYRVDVINENNERFVPTRHYAFFVGNRINFARIARLLNPDCVKILHIDTSHWLFHNMAEWRRLELLQLRRSCVLLPRRTLPANSAIEHADYATVLGTQATMDTYRYANKPLFPIPISTPVVYPWHDGKDFETVRHRYLWFGSEGCVHKGLDLVLEAFVELPEHHLTVCGAVRSERDFEREYFNELYHTPNIHMAGWVDVRSAEFLAIANSCAALVYPSCSEGQSGAVVTCMHAGLIPIISRESGVDVQGFGHILTDCSVETIKDSVRTISRLPANELSTRARGAWEYARATHTRDQFANVYARTIGHIMVLEGQKERVCSAPRAVEGR